MNNYFLHTFQSITYIYQKASRFPRLIWISLSYPFRLLAPSRRTQCCGLKYRSAWNYPSKYGESFNELINMAHFVKSLHAYNETICFSWIILKCLLCGPSKKICQRGIKNLLSWFRKKDYSFLGTWFNQPVKCYSGKIGCLWCLAESKWTSKRVKGLKLSWFRWKFKLFMY